MTKSADFYTLMQNCIFGHESPIATHLSDPPKGTLADRIAIYADGFYTRLEEVLRGDYATLTILLGDIEFQKLSQAYVIQHPSSTYSLFSLGQYLSDYLRQTAPYHEKPYLAEIAAFEWAESQATMRADGRLLGMSNLQNLSCDAWPSVRFSLHPSCYFLDLKWNSLSIIEALRENDNRVVIPQKMPVSQTVMIWRQDQAIAYRMLDEVELTALHAIKQHASFEEIGEHLACSMKDEDVAMYLVQKLHMWLNDEILCHPLA